MARTGRPLPALELSPQEREKLRRLTRRHITAQALAHRARLRGGALGPRGRGGARRHPHEVGKWRRT